MRLRRPTPPVAGRRQFPGPGGSTALTRGEPAAGPIATILGLQRAAGNQAAARAAGDQVRPTVVQRKEPPVSLPAYRSTDPLVDLTPVVGREGQAWQLTLVGDYTTAQAVGRLLWPHRPTPPLGVSLTPLMVVEGEGRQDGPQRTSAVGYVQGAVWEVGGLRIPNLVGMDELFLARFADLGLVEDTAGVKAARAGFRARHQNLGGVVLANIDTALSLATRNNPGLLEAYYTFYQDWKLTGDIDSSSGHAGQTDRTAWRGGFTDVNAAILQLASAPRVATDNRLSLLAETLMHEFAHTAHVTDTLKGPGEGKAYGIENFFAHRLGDQRREDDTDSLGPRMGDKLAFDTAYFVMKSLYDVIDGRGSKLPSLQGMTRQRARELSVEFVAKNRAEFSAELRQFILTEWNTAGFSSLPSVEP